MMNLLVISDSHGRSENVEAAIKRQLALPQKFRATHLLHLGDGVSDVDKCALASRLCVCAVRGNCDSFFYADSLVYERVLELGGARILMMHGHTRGVKGGDGSAVLCAAALGADILLYGHTHTPISYTLEKGSEINGVVLSKRLSVFNPGSIGYDASFGMITIDGDNIICSHGCLK